MTPVDQVRTGFGQGQCTEASIASLLGVPLESVPDLWAGPQPEGASARDHQPLANLVRMWNWLKVDHGLMMAGGRVDRPMTVEAVWVACRGALPFAYDGVWDRYHLASGPNPDGVSHFVVGEHGKIVHDPNPRRRGITACDAIYWLVPLSLMPEDCRDLPSAEWLIDP